MKKEEAASGLRPRMTRLARTPNAAHEAPEAAQATHDANHNRHILQEIVRRKRRNDLVRRSEFEHLRSLIRHKTQQTAADPAEQLSMFYASVKPTAGVPGGTLRKINEIEAQMSRQWWKSTTSGDVPSRLPAPTRTHGNEVKAIKQAPSAFAATAPQPTGFFPNAIQAVAKNTPFATTRPASLSSPPEQTDAGSLNLQLNLAVQASAPMRSAPPTAPTAPTTPRPVAQPVAPQAEIFVHDPELEEAAICFANGDWNGAQASLMEVLSQRKKGALESQHEIWMTLFDFYRATGQKGGFDALAIDYAACFGRSAPLWFSLPEQLGLSDTQEADTDSASNGQRALNWSAQPQLSAQSIAALRVLLTRATPPWTFNWQRLTGIQPPAVTALAELFESLADTAEELRFVGVTTLHGILESYTQTGDNSGNPEWWHLRLAALRLTGQEEAFENVAIDYCITYEMSPPSWLAPRCTYSDDAGGRTTAQAADTAGGASTGFLTGFAALTTGMPEAETPRAVIKTDPLKHKAELTGHIEGDAAALLEPFTAYVQLDLPLIVSCERLIRLDFAASGSVLNWAAVQQAQGRTVQFARLHRLAAVFFNTVGINEHAQIIVRKD